MNRMTIACPADIVATVNKAWKVLVLPPGGDLTFQAPYCADDSNTITHYVSSGVYGDAEAAAISEPMLLWNLLGQYAAARGRTLGIGQTAFLTAYGRCWVSPPDVAPQRFLFGLGLTPVQGVDD